jgi:hypothetical protein
MNKDLITMIDKQNLQVVSVNKEQGTFLCNDGNEYPLEGDLTVEELQKHLDKAKKIMKEMLLQDGETVEP